MWKIRERNILLLLILNLISVVLSLYVGDKCYHNGKSANGECKLLDNCPGDISDLSKSIYPQNCGFVKSAVIVCCVESSTSSNTPTTPKYSPVIPDTREKNKTDVATSRTGTGVPLRIQGSTPVGEKSRQKCKEYEDYALVEEVAPILLGTSEVVKSSICPWVLEPKVIGGTEAKQGEFPHMALLGYHDKNTTQYRCGGSLISENFVLTAAHCILDSPGGRPVIVRLGDLNITNPNDDQYLQMIKIKHIYKHENFDPDIVLNDIALLELTKAAVLSVFVKPICLYTEEELDVDKGLATGWGRTEKGASSDILLKVWLDLFPENSCVNTYKNTRININYNDIICAGSYNRSRDTCRGDSGGPLQMYHPDVQCSHYVFAVTSFGLRCGRANVPALYTRVYPHLKWIENIVWP